MYIIVNENWVYVLVLYVIIIYFFYIIRECLVLNMV